MDANEYTAIAQEFGLIKDQIFKFRRLISFVGDRITDHKFSFSGLSCPPEIAMGDSVCDASEWPTADTIQELINKRHLLRKKLLSAWATMTPELRRGLKDPDSL